MLLGSQGRRQLATLGGVSLVGIEMVISMAIGHHGGGWLDERFGTAPVLARLGFFFGIVAGFRSLYRTARKEWAKAEAESAEADPANPGHPARGRETDDGPNDRPENPG